jgi:hypothetical protein
MKKFSLGFMVLFVGLLFTSCPGAPPAYEPPPPPPPPAPAPAPEPVPEPVVVGLDLTGAQQYVVVAGDILSNIARRFYGGLGALEHGGRENGFFFPAIMLASPAVTDPDVLVPGMVLTIPDLRRNLDNPGARQAMREAMLETATLNQGRNRLLDVEGLRRLANSL